VARGYVRPVFLPRDDVHVNTLRIATGWGPHEVGLRVVVSRELARRGVRRGTRQTFGYRLGPTRGTVYTVYV